MEVCVGGGGYVCVDVFSVHAYKNVYNIHFVAIWTAQGQILFSNSDTKTLGRNTAIFWMFLQSA